MAGERAQPIAGSRGSKHHGQVIKGGGCGFSADKQGTALSLSFERVVGSSSMRIAGGSINSPCWGLGDLEGRLLKKTPG